MKKSVLLVVAVLALLGVSAGNLVASGGIDYRVVPLPHSIELKSGSPFVINGKTRVLYAADNVQMRQNASFLTDYIYEQTGLLLKPARRASGSVIVLELGLVSENPEAYQIEVKSDRVTIKGASEAGVFYGIQTLRKSLPIGAASEVKLPAVTITDSPRFSYRGMMLDVSRHFFSVEEVKTFIDMLVLHNINTFHWHLTEDQGWRIEIKKYPRLTEIGSKRKETVIGRNSGRYDGQPYGGFYTQEDIKEVLDYADKRFIDVIPEVDMPGHMLAALAAYPELGCTGGPYEVWTQWGISEDVLCVGNDKTLEFVKDVLHEVMDLFPSEYIHIGGDECPKSRWEECPTCQTAIKKHGLHADEAHSAEERLQSHFITYVEQIINDRGRRMIGWDEILEGGLAPNATVMSWRGMAGGIEAARMGHDVVMTPNSHLYFDHYQSTDISQDPIAIGGYSPVSNVYSLEPVPAVLTKEQQKHVLGVQANLWTEYIPVFEQAQFMVLPRMAALSEVQWMDAEKKDYQDFLSRLVRHLEFYKAADYNYARHIFDIKADFVPNAKDRTIDVNLSALGNSPIYYTLDGTAPVYHSAEYKETLKIDRDAQLMAVTYFDDGKSRVFNEEISFNKATTRKIEALQSVDRQYGYEGIGTLVDGLRGNQNYRTGRWIAFRGNDLEAVIDLEASTVVQEASISTNVVKGDWIFDLRSFTVLISDDGKVFSKVASVAYAPLTPNDSDGIKQHTLRFDSASARYVKIVAESEKSMPEWHGGRGLPGYLFVDEIILR